MPLPQKMPSRSGSKVPATRRAAAAASRAAASAIAVARSSGTLDGDATAAASKAALATGTGGSSMPGRSSACARTAERPAKSASSKAASEQPSGLTTPAPLTATPSRRRASAGGGIAPGPRRDRLVDQAGELLERDAGLARVEALLGDAHVEAVLDREYELHQR